MSAVQIPDAQQRLRSACQTGDIRTFQNALTPQTPSWKQEVWSWLRGRHQETECLPAKLDFVYEDDQCNLPVHYLANGKPASM